jgi:hypothetical protein
MGLFHKRPATPPDYSTLPRLDLLGAPETFSIYKTAAAQREIRDLYAPAKNGEILLYVSGIRDPDAPGGVGIGVFYGKKLLGELPYERVPRAKRRLKRYCNEDGAAATLAHISQWSPEQRQRMRSWPEWNIRVDI